jgi:hypothetical protein
VEVCPGAPAADWGTSRYSAESTVDPFAATVMHPESPVGSTLVYPPALSVIGVPWPGPHEVTCGVGASATTAREEYQGDSATPPRSHRHHASWTWMLTGRH